MEEVVSLNGKLFKIQYNSLKDKISALKELESLQTNLVQNPGFEVATASQWLPDNWFNGVDTAGWVFPYGSPQDLPGRSGKGAAIIRTTTGNAYWGQHITGLSPSTSYTLTGYAMTTSVVGTGALIEIDWFDASNNYISGSASTSTPITGTNSWTQLTVTSTAPSNAAAANVILLLSGTGTAVFDDISFTGGGGGGGTAGYNCVSGNCTYVTSGAQYSTLSACQSSCTTGGCVPPCPAGYVCQGTTCVPTGGCVPPCSAGYVCQGTTCVPTGGGGTTCDPVTCPSSKNYCVGGTCVPKNYVMYGGIAFGALFLLSILKR